jgi:hypothetical protein
VLESSRQRLLEGLTPDQVVLDVGGWADPFERADWVIDLMPYETRGLYSRRGWAAERDRGAERFTADTWVQRDICDRAPWPFEDGAVDFAICAQTLEDVRDPVWVCGELMRVARAGYIEVPSRRSEQSFGVAGPYAGWPHHRWLVDIEGSRIEFVHKPHSIHWDSRRHLPTRFWRRLSEEERMQALWWEGGFEVGERVIVDAEEAASYLEGFVARELAERPPGRRGWAELRERVRRGLR